MKKRTIYKQGRSFPPSAHGVGLIFLFMAIFLVYVVELNYWFLSFGYVSVWIMFSRTHIDTTNVEDGLIIKKYGFFPIKFKDKIYLNDYDVGVVKKIRVKYKTTQSTGFIVLSSQNNSDSYLALQLKKKGKNEYETLFKGSKIEIENFIKENLKDINLKFYQGVVRKGYEITIL